jgi:hypothetical protein
MSPVKAVDHDMSPETLLVPFGVLELNRGGVEIHQPWILFGHSIQTSDFIADGLDRWWRERRATHVGVKRIQIELDNGYGGPHCLDQKNAFLSYTLDPSFGLFLRHSVSPR